MDNKLQISKKIKINASRAKVWEILTSENNIEKWLGVKTKCEWATDSKIEFHFSWEGKSYIDKGVILEFEPENSFSYSYWSIFSGVPDSKENYSVIKFTLDTGNGQTELTLSHSNFSNQTMYEHSDTNWDDSLATIKKLAELESRDDK